jgi:hypothetical protein
MSEKGWQSLPVAGSVRLPLKQARPVRRPSPTTADEVTLPSALSTVNFGLIQGAVWLRACPLGGVIQGQLSKRCSWASAWLVLER